MNEKQIESLLRKAPSPATPEGLKQTLLNDIHLPRTNADAPEGPEASSWLKRWLPALSFAAFFLTRFVVLGIQALNLKDLRQQNEALKARATELSANKLPTPTEEQMKLAEAELARLKSDNVEAAKLRQEVADLKARLPDITVLSQENQRLRLARSSPSGQFSGNQGEEDLMDHAQRIKCVNNLKQIGLAARIWANDYNNQYPPDFLSMTNELVSPKILQCPSDKAHSVTDWVAVANGLVSYELLTPGLDMKVERNPNIVFALCRAHRNICLMDGSVQQLSPERMQNNLKTVDGRLVLVP